MNQLRIGVGDAAARVRRRQDTFEAAARDGRVVAEQLAAAPYAGLTTHSLALSSVRPSGALSPAVNLVVPHAQSSSAFAGLRTALQGGAQMSRLSGRPLRIVPFLTPGRRDGERFVAQVRREFGLKQGQVGLLTLSELDGAAVSTEDIWVATFWTTAHALDVASRLERIRRDRVIYMVQDYEPSFFPHSTPAALAHGTYLAGFEMIVNSAPLAVYLRSQTTIEISTDAVFAPQLDLGRLEASARAAGHGDYQPVVLFYGRPSKPRNMFDLGVAALRATARQHAASGKTLRVLSLGEHHPPLTGPGLDAVTLGHLAWSDYFVKLAEGAIMLSLQASPHPSHPPLDMVARGGFSVTNEVGRSRSGIHPRLLAVDPAPDALADAVQRALAQAAEAGPQPFDADFVSKLGGDFSAVVDRAVARLTTVSR